MRSRAGSSRGSATAPSASSTATTLQPASRCAAIQRSLGGGTQWMHGLRDNVSPLASALR